LNGKICRGEIYYIHPTETTGSEQRMGRPAIIVSNDIGNAHSPTFLVVPMTTRHKKFMPTHTVINSLPLRSTALCEALHQVDQSLIGKYLGSITEQETAALNRALANALALDKEGAI